MCPGQRTSAGVLGILFGVQVVEVPEELVEAVRGRQELVAVPKMVLAELPGRVAHRLEQLRRGHVARLQADGCARHADLRKAGAQRGLSGDEARAAGSARLLGVVVREEQPLAGDAVDVRRLVAHDAERVGADVRLPNVVAEDHEDVGLLRRLRRRGRGERRERAGRRGQAGENTEEGPHTALLSVAV
jgi:hypothetical protein